MYGYGSYESVEGQTDSMLPIRQIVGQKLRIVTVFENPHWKKLPDA